MTTVLAAALAGIRGALYIRGAFNERHRSRFQGSAKAVIA
jgi:hypothetical protein